MDNYRFSWDEQKHQENVRKHNVSFDEAKTIFDDENARLKHDPDHSDDEDRFLLIGFSTKLRLLLVVHVYRPNEDEEIDEIRLISARKATRNEAKQYEQF